MTYLRHSYENIRKSFNSCVQGAGINLCVLSFMQIVRFNFYVNVYIYYKLAKLYQAVI